MYVYYNPTTPFLAFLEGMVRVFDWGALLELRRRWARRRGRAEPEPLSGKDKEWSERIVDRYIRNAIATFESEESGRLSEDTMLPRRSFAVADILLGPLPTQEIILRYEQTVPGASDRIMNIASSRLDHDGKTEIELLKQRGRQGFMGMAAGFILSLLLAASAMYLFIVGHDWAGFSILGLEVAMVVAATVYISKAQVREKLYTRDFFSIRKRKP